jgi:amidohydrolase
MIAAEIVPPLKGVFRMCESVVRFRRDLHRIPELDNRLDETTAYVRRVLSALPCRVSSPIRGSVCAYFDAGRPATVAFRADLDALPGEETTGLPFASVHPGAMHACGHDGHTALALGLAEYAAAHLSDLPRNLLLVFQPSEETTGGAKPLCESGVLERCRVRRIFGLHLWPGLPQGQIFSRPGPLMARSSEVTVTVEGKSVHISRYTEGRDALTAGIDCLRRSYAMIDQLPPDEPRVLRFGKMTSGTVRNAVSGRTELEGSLRTYREDTFRFCKKRLEEIGRSVAEESGCAVSVRLSEGYPAVWNHEELYELLVRQLGADAPALLDTPALGADDFSFYQQEVPGIYFFLGVGDTPSLHAPNFNFDDTAVLPAGEAFLTRLLTLA